VILILEKKMDKEGWGIQWRKTERVFLTKKERKTDPNTLETSHECLNEFEGDGNF
jgi:hypothetical protein